MIEILIICCALTAFYYPTIMNFFELPLKYKIVENYKFKIEESEEFKLAVLLPKDGPYQKVSNLIVEGLEPSEIIDHEYIQVVRFEGKLEKDTNIRIKYDATLKNGDITWDEEILEEYLNEEIGIEVSNEKIVSKANSLVEGKSLEDIEEVYEFVNTYIEWPKGDQIYYGENIQSAVEALETKQGVCGDFANLMTALLRAKGIPAKSISGLAMPLQPLISKSNWSHHAAAHAWTEFYIEESWHFADPSWGGDSMYDNVDGRHLSYGPSINEGTIYAENTKWVIGDMIPIGGMSNPLKFITGSDSGLVQVTPVGYIDSSIRFVLLILFVTIFIGLETYYWIKKPNFKEVKS